MSFNRYYLEAKLIRQPCATARLPSSVRLSLAIHRNELELQNKLLHVLHSIVHSIDAFRKRSTHHDHTPEMEHRSSREEHISETSECPPVELLQVIVDGVSLQSDTAILHHWIDFVLMSLPQLRHSLHGIVVPVLECLIKRVEEITAQIELSWAPKGTISHNARKDLETDLTILLNALEHLLLTATEEDAKFDWR